VWGAAAIGIVKLLQGRRGGSTPPAAS
jgi:hypothetical protein